MSVASGSGSEINIFLFYQREKKLQLCRLAKWYCKQASYSTVHTLMMTLDLENYEKNYRWYCFEHQQILRFKSFFSSLDKNDKND
jgi:hypothetical protein